MLLCLEPKCTCTHHRLLDCLKTEAKSTEAKLLLQNIENFCQLADNSGKTLLHYAAKYGNAEMVEYLIDKGCNVNAQDIDGYTALTPAVQNQQLTIVEVLLKNKADYSLGRSLELAARYFVDSLNPEDKVSWTYERILEKFFVKMSMDLWTNKRKVGEALWNGSHSLRLATVVSGNEQLCRYLLENGYPVDFYEPEHGLPALHCAIIMAKVENAKLLVEYGADVNALDTRGNSPLSYYAREFQYVDKQSEVLRSMLKNYVITDDGIPEVADLLRHGNRQIVKAVLGSEKIRAHFEGDGTLLYLLCKNDNDDVLEVLDELDIRFDVNALIEIAPSPAMMVEDPEAMMMDDEIEHNEIAMTALMMAARYRRENQIKFLLRHGADPQRVYEDGSTFLKCVFQTYAHDHVRENLIKFITAHLALLSALGQLYLTENTQRIIAGDPISRTHFDLCAGQLEEMKNIKVYDAVTLFEFLSGRDDKLVNYANNKQLILAFNSTMERSKNLEPYYFSILQKRVAEAKDKSQLDNEAAAVIERLTGLSRDVYQIIVYKIISYLSLQDLLSLAKA